MFCKMLLPVFVYIMKISCKILQSLGFQNFSLRGEVLHILDTILVHCILHILGTILVHCLI